MRRFLSMSLTLLFLAAFPLAAQQILPHSLGRWTAAQNAGEPLRASALSSLTPIAPRTVLAEYGWASSEWANYGSADGTADGMQASVFKMKDPSGGYGLYSFLRTPDMARADFTEHSSVSRDRTLILIGNLVVDIEGQDLSKFETEIKSLVATVRTHAQDGPLPALWEHLPEKKIVEGSDRYVLGPQTLNQLFPGGLGDSIGFPAGAEAEIAHYHLGSRDVSLLLADFPTPQLAEDTLAGLQKRFNVNGSNAGANSPALFAKRSLTLVAIVSGALSQTEADALLDQVHSGTVLTWNEPAFQFQEPSIEVMVVGTFVGTGAICGFTLVASLAFGGFRLFIKRLMPGRIFDRGVQLQILQLGLSSKPVNAEDFYASPGPPVPKGQVDENLPDRIALRIFR
jgi:hypothetical protein